MELIRNRWHRPRPLWWATWLSVLVLLIFASSLSAQGQWDSYPAVYELDSWSLDWSPVHGLRVHAHRIVRVNRSDGADAGRIRIWDTFFQRLTDFEGEVRDTAGNVLFRVGPKDVRTIAPFSEFRLYSGDVVRAVDLVAPQPPYVIEAEWTVEIDNPFFWPDWVLADRLPRRRAVYKVAIPKNKKIRHLQIYPALVQTERRTSRRKVTTWELHDWTPPDGGAEDAGGSYPLLHVAPEEFRVGRHKGRTDSWDALGRWYGKLTADRIDLNNEQRTAVDQHLADIFGDRARAASLKDWVSDRWRYVAIEVGLGGWKPHKAQEVFANRYGDCKDVVFLWMAMMQQAGLEAFPALIRARNPLPIDPDFPKDWFDHVVGVTVINGDTLWADPSDGRYPLGTLPRRCESRWALVVGDFGGRLMRTPALAGRRNRLITHCEGWLDADGHLDFRARVHASGHFARRLPLRGELDDRDAVATILGIAPPALEATVERIEVVAADAIAVHLRGRITGWALADAEQMQLRPRVAGWAAVDTLVGRPDPVRVGFPRIVYDTLVIHFPPGWTPNLWPTAPFHSEAAGEMGEGRTFTDTTLTIVRHLRWEGTDRSAAERRAEARLSRALQSAQNADWLFNSSGPLVPVSDDTTAHVPDSRTVSDTGTAPAGRLPSDTVDDGTAGE